MDTPTSLRLPSPWQSPRNAFPNLRSLRLGTWQLPLQVLVWATSQLTVSLLFPQRGWVFTDETPLECAWDGKGEWKIESQPQINPILQNSVYHTRLCQWDIPHKAGLGIFLYGICPHPDTYIY